MINQSWEGFWIEMAEESMITMEEFFQRNLEIYGTTCYNIHYLETFERDLTL